VDVSSNVYRRNALALLLVAEFLAPAAFGEGISLDSAGIRFGFPGGDATGFYQGEAFVDWNLPWKWDLGRDWKLQTRVDLSAGCLGKSNDHAAVGTVGPILALGHGHLPVWLEGGSSPTLISRDSYGQPPQSVAKDFGDPFQFTSHIGVYWNVATRVRVGYRFQHMSNAGIASPNPGLNLNFFYASYLF
jgi:hypothetical protein